MSKSSNYGQHIFQGERKNFQVGLPTCVPWLRAWLLVLFVFTHFLWMRLYFCDMKQVYRIFSARCSKRQWRWSWRNSWKA